MKKADAWKLNALKGKHKSILSHRKLSQAKDNEKQNVKAHTKSRQKFKQGWREFGGHKIFYRSKWESNFARYLEWQKERNMIKSWEHEPQTFWFEGIKRGVVSYLPDFKIITLSGDHYWIEVKGFMDAKSKTKIKRFLKFFPKEKLLVVDSTWYRQNQKKLSEAIEGWEK